MLVEDGGRAFHSRGPEGTSVARVYPLDHPSITLNTPRSH